MNGVIVAQEPQEEEEEEEEEKEVKEEKEEKSRKNRPTLMLTRQKAPDSVSLLAYEIMPVEGRLTDCEVHEALENMPKWNGGDSFGAEKEPPSRSFWIDVEIPRSTDLKCLARHKSNLFDVLPPFLRRHLLQPSQLEIPQTLVLPQYALTVLRVLPNDSAGFAAYSLRHAAAICLRGVLITITTKKSDKVEEADHKQSLASLNLFQLLDTSRHLWDQVLPEGSTTGALCAWLHKHVMRVSLVLYRLRTEILELCKQMDQDPSDVDLSEIVLMKDSLLRISAVAEEQDEVLQTLRKGQSNAVDFGSAVLKSQLKAMLATSGATERQSHRLDKRLAYVRSLYESLRQDRINQRLAVLTIVSAVFMPMTLMAGIWGMNFVNIPELERENGYYFALAAMAGVGITLLLIFWRLGWFG